MFLERSKRSKQNSKKKHNSNFLLIPKKMSSKIEQQEKPKDNGVWVEYYDNRFKNCQKKDKEEDESKGSVVVEKEADLHVVSGWTDVEADVWTRYVRSVVKDLGISNDGNGMSMFELGCGCLGFLEQVRLVYPKLEFAGMDGSPAFLDWLDAEKGYKKENFYQGFLPKGLKVEEEEEKYDFVVCNSVFQYLTRDQAAETVRRALRLVKKGGIVMICDVCDEASKDVEETFMKHHVPGYGEGKSHTYYSKSWWTQFDGKVSYFHSDAEGYRRKKTRYQAVIQK